LVQFWVFNSRPYNSHSSSQFHSNAVNKEHGCEQTYIYPEPSALCQTASLKWCLVQDIPTAARWHSPDLSGCPAANNSKRKCHVFWLGTLLNSRKLKSSSPASASDVKVLSKAKDKQVSEHILNDTSVQLGCTVPFALDILENTGQKTI